MVQLSSTLRNPMDCSPPGSFIHKDSPGKYPGVGPMPSSKGSSQTRDWTQVSHIAGRFFTVWATREGDIIVDWLYFPCCTFHICDLFICDSSFQVPIGHLYIFFGKTSIQILCPFFTIGLFYIVWGFYVESYEFCILWILIPCRHVIYKHLLPFSKQSLHFVDSFLHYSNIF